jgi:hypothetical protein
MGCQTSVSVDVSAVQGIGSGQAGRVKVCIGTTPTCALVMAPKGQDVVEAVFPAGTIPGPGLSPDKPIAVTVTVMNPGQPLVDDTVEATFTKLAPNGEACGPVCYTTHVVATNRGVSTLPIDASSSPSS